MCSLLLVLQLLTDCASGQWVVANQIAASTISVAQVATNFDGPGYVFRVGFRSQPPDPSLTPGVVRPLTTAQVCATRWGKDRRHVTAAMKLEVERRYRISGVVTSGKGWCCELDHLIPRELGGADDVNNLWPEPWADARVKDAEENRLHRAVCAGTVTLAAAQELMRHWGTK